MSLTLTSIVASVVCDATAVECGSETKLWMRKSGLRGGLVRGDSGQTDDAYSSDFDAAAQGVFSHLYGVESATAAPGCHTVELMPQTNSMLSTPSQPPFLLAEPVIGETFL